MEWSEARIGEIDHNCHLTTIGDALELLEETGFDLSEIGITDFDGTLTYWQMMQIEILIARTGLVPTLAGEKGYIRLQGNKVR